jgi:glutathione S-transferase
MKLYLSPGACSMSCHIAFEEGKIKFESCLGQWEEVKRLNPQGAVPVLVMNDGKVLTQNVAILTCAAIEAPQLMPRAGTWDYLEAMKWLAWTNSDLHPAFGPLFNDQVTPEARTQAVAGVTELLAQAEKHMEGKSFLAGNQFTIADCLFFAIYGWTKSIQLSTTQFPNLNAYVARISERPAVQTVMKREGLLG